MDKIDLNNFNIRTDLALEAIDLYNYKDSNDIKEEKYTKGKVTVTKITVEKGAEEHIHKKAGIYYTLDTSAILTHDHDDLLETENVLTDVLREILEHEQIKPESTGLIVGLGNYNVTPDSLGPVVVDNVMVTRHMFLLQPESISEGVRNVSALAPGVMGTTGIETSDIIQSVIDKIKVDYVIVIDALASRSIHRVNKTIQITNTGISPGSGVGNKRKELSKDTLGIPVIAIGIPTVVDIATITYDVIDFVLRYLNYKIKNDAKPSNSLLTSGERVALEEIDLPTQEQAKVLLGTFGSLSEQEKRSLLAEILTPNGYNMMVTPKEIDIDIDDLSKVISRAIDRAIHPIVNDA